MFAEKHGHKQWLTGAALRTYKTAELELTACALPAVSLTQTIDTKTSFSKQNHSEVRQTGSLSYMQVQMHA